MRACVPGVWVLLLSLLLWPVPVSPQEGPQPVRPARVERMQNLEVAITASFRPSYLPREWGRLVDVERMDNASVMLFLEGAKGEIYLVRLAQHGGYLFLDTADRGGLVTVLPREP
ncbi:MAG: hypothetical protein HY656_06895 [Acidobacteria bacterium]|nr:hypothetical protein [Acidobacteriota bacterium]